MLKVSFNQPYEKVKDKNGFGYAAKMCKESLETLGHEWQWRWPEADVEINFIQPQHWHWTGVDYRIGYVPWESTEFPEFWIKEFNEVDEMWTPSHVVADWMRAEGVRKPIYVYEHGVDDIWRGTKRERPSQGRLQILHHGAEALRKGGNEAIQAMMHTLWDKDAQLVMKMILQNFNLHDTDHLRVLKTIVPIEELVKIYQDCHMMLYPSWGEGFGLVPIQAMATGMPVLITKGWAPYERFLSDDNLISSELTVSPWQVQHPGKMFRPDQEDMEAKLLNMYENYERYAEQAWEIAPKVIAEYNWIDLTRAAFSHLETGKNS